jgi:protein-disulfide isomerase
MRRIALTITLVLLPAIGNAEPVATVGGRSISRTEVESHVRPKLVEIENQRYEALHDGLEEMIAEELFKQEAKARGITPEALEKQEVESKLPEPTDTEIQQIYDANKEELNNESLESAKPRIVEYLKQYKAVERRVAFVNELKTKHKVQITLRPPVVQVGTGGRPERGGGAKAPVTIIAFSDYECPFCKQAEGTVEKVLKTYGDKVRYVHRDFPLAIHAHARQASEAARCANEQGKFWEYHTKLFATDDLATEKLQTLASEVGLDRTKFDECLAKQPFEAAIEKDITDGTNVGVSGTPAFFINGRMFSGAQPFDKFKEVIDEELTRAKKTKSS